MNAAYFSPLFGPLFQPLMTPNLSVRIGLTYEPETEALLARFTTPPTSDRKFIRSSPQIGTETGAYQSGSGTLVNMGGVHGILTAGHVFCEIERDGHFVMPSATGPGDRVDAHKVEIEPGATLSTGQARSVV
jgi:hypothetical protein